MDLQACIDDVLIMQHMGTDARGVISVDINMIPGATPRASPHLPAVPPQQQQQRPRGIPLPRPRSASLSPPDSPSSNYTRGDSPWVRHAEQQLAEEAAAAQAAARAQQAAEAAETRASARREAEHKAHVVDDSRGLQTLLDALFDGDGQSLVSPPPHKPLPSSLPAEASGGAGQHVASLEGRWHEAAEAGTTVDGPACGAKRSAESTSLEWESSSPRKQQRVGQPEQPPPPQVAEADSDKRLRLLAKRDEWQQFERAAPQRAGTPPQDPPAAQQSSGAAAEGELAAPPPHKGLALGPGTAPLSAEPHLAEGGPAAARIEPQALSDEADAKSDSKLHPAAATEAPPVTGKRAPLPPDVLAMQEDLQDCGIYGTVLEVRAGARGRRRGVHAPPPRAQCWLCRL